MTVFVVALMKQTADRAPATLSLEEGLNMNGMVEVELHSTEPSAVRATRLTIDALPGGILAEEGGRYFVPVGFVAFACRSQGYVKRVIEVECKP